MGKRFLAFLLSICMLASLVPAPAHAHEACDDHSAHSGEVQLPAQTEQLSTPNAEINAAASLSVHTLPDKTLYLVGDAIDLTGLTLNYFNGSTTKTILVSDGITLVSGSTAAPGRACTKVDVSCQINAEHLWIFKVLVNYIDCRR